MKKDRSRWEIVEDMLVVLIEEKRARKTRIMQRACLDWRNFQRYFNYLLEEDFIVPNKEGYELTKKGMECLMKLKEIDGMLNRKS